MPDNTGSFLINNAQNLNTQNINTPNISSKLSVGSSSSEMTHFFQAKI